jgi:hypothetical protein
MACSSRQARFELKGRDGDEEELQTTRFCFLCTPNVELESKKALDDHGCRNHSPFVCNKCNEKPRFKTFGLLNAHHKFSHQDEGSKFHLHHMR